MVIQPVGVGVGSQQLFDFPGREKPGNGDFNGVDLGPA
jgi:hypothetical protein